MGGRGTNSGLKSHEKKQQNRRISKRQKKQFSDKFKKAEVTQW